jgi:dipeptidyl aminopeptidase/acylaminoacyl peptidase
MTSDPDPRSRVFLRTVSFAMLLILAATLGACRAVGVAPSATSNVEPFSFQITVGKSQYQIEAYLARSSKPGPLPALLVLNGGESDARKCADANRDLTELGMQVACVSIPGYGRSSGPGRFVGPQAVAAARRALDLLAERKDVDPTRLGVWGLSDGAVAAGLLMDVDPRPRAVVLQSGAYDMLTLWPEARWTTKLSILRQVWPSSRVLKERSVIQHLPPRLDCSVLILHGERDRKTPVDQAEHLAQALRERGTRVQEYYFPTAPHSIGKQAEPRVADFLRDNLLNSSSQAKS